MNTFSTDYATWGSDGSPIVFNTDTGCDTATTNTFTLVAPDPLIDWLPYHYKKYLPTWHLVRSYQHDRR